MGVADDFFGVSLNPSAPQPSVKEEGVVEGAVNKFKEFFGMSAHPEGEPAREPIKLMPRHTLESMFPNVLVAETNNKHMTNGKITTSPSGAEGVSQLMPATAKNPGYGIKGVKDKSEGEYVRVGKAYLGAMLKKFEGDAPKALAAYNAGVGNVMKAVEKGGEQWMDFLPNRSETLPYIDKILKTTYAEGLAKRKGAEGVTGVDPSLNRPAAEALPITDYKTLVKEGKLTGLSEAATQFLDEHSNKISTYTMTDDTAGFVYPQGDRVFLGKDSPNTLVHETEHRRQDQTESQHETSMKLMRNGKQSPAQALFEYAKSNAKSRAVWDVFGGGNSTDNASEFYANLQAFSKQDLKGKNWGDTAFYKKLEKDVGESAARTMLTDALMTLARKGAR